MTDEEIKAVAKSWDFDLDEYNGWTEETFISFVKECIQIELNKTNKANNDG